MLGNFISISPEPEDLREALVLLISVTRKRNQQSE
jgi:hypothetical protein